jgi:peptidoglycan/LPS O-acetylase OafA/YrhL
VAVGAAAVGTLRLILASAVLLVHAGSLFRFNITGGGQVPVELFYIISGFYMALVLNEKYTGPGSARAFYLNRLLRLLPAYWVMAVLALAIYLYIYAVTGGGFIAWMAGALSEAESWRAAWFYVSNAILVGIDWLGRVLPVRAPNTPILVAPAWTLGVELSFYAIAPLVLRRSPWVIAAVLAASICLRLSYFAGVDFGVDPWGYAFFPYELALFMAGALSYRLYDKIRTQTGGAAFGLSLVAVVFLFQIIQKGMTLAICNCDPTVVPLRIALYGYAAVAIAFLFRETKNNKIDRELGELSYLVYLAHYPLIELYNVLFHPGPSMAQGALRSVVILLASLIVAVLVRRFVERPIDAIRHQRIRSRPLLQSA